MFHFRARAAAMVVAGLASMSGVAHAEPMELRLATFGPPTSYFYADTIIPWSQAVNKDSQGTIDIKFYGGGVLANAANMYDSVMTGAVDIGWSILPPSFARTSVIELPFGYENGEEGALALWRLYDKGLIAEDFKGTVLLGITSWPGAVIAGRKSIEKLEDLKGQKIAVGSRRRGEIVAALGGVPVSVPTDETYNALDKGVVDGVLTSHTATRQFKLHEVAKNWTNTALTGSTAFLFMSKERFDGLPAPARAALEKHSGEALSRALGRSNDGEIKRALAFMKDQAANGKVAPVRDIAPAELPKWKNAVRNVYSDFDKKVPNGKAIREAYFATLADIRAGK